ncbi:alkanesulfonates ABC transporter ATP-binding protein / Sulfonate ABC transporter [Klebsiella quasipneumoniae]|uniref:ABC transporter ATP-binding protein n=1 Tax=Klebsiella quasipneumoniae TaxID=1463165 RepID=UPI001083BC2A|nr:ABC transporter ATP-binding protein [Klebsiella quasipneumoniae]VGG46602.1 alkanesulfonates ABC transporter ATP-binding protein / Sulfonate ABC transporter [Klebsiella quasipneumoniae]HCI6875842.1 ABC transporter ATP-binding protein [Klebsiella quasipneumoniae subsp. similipneumoniae]
MVTATSGSQTIARGAAVSISHLHHAFTLGKQAVPVLENISLQLQPGESVALLGPSGCGKSTLLRLLAGLEAPQSGQMQFDGAPLGAPGPERILVFQDPTLYPWLTVRQNVLLGPQAQGKRGLEAKADALIDRIGLQAFSEAWPRQLSGGMAQRAALLNEPRLLLLDEPLGKLDSLTRISMQRELIALWQQQGYTSLLMTHDIEEALLLCERVLVMSPRPGRIIAEFALPLDFPRHRDNPQLLQHRQDILRILGQEEDW